MSAVSLSKVVQMAGSESSNTTQYNAMYVMYYGVFIFLMRTVGNGVKEKDVLSNED